MATRAERIGQNEALFRRVNERLEELNEAFSMVSDTFDLVCECGDLECGERLEVKPRDYEAVRSDPAAFIVAPGHEARDLDVVVERRESYQVIRKRPGEPEHRAEETDPRG